jgi:hypothetical protein
MPHAFAGGVQIQEVDWRAHTRPNRCRRCAWALANTAIRDCGLVVPARVSSATSSTDPGTTAVLDRWRADGLIGQPFR